MNTAERAWVRLQVRWNLPRTHFSFKIKRKIAAPGTFSDGTRALTIEPCPSFRWIMAKDGTGKILAEVDQRDFWDSPTEMADAFLAKIDALETPYRSELTPAGEQLVIPGCERNLAPAAKQLSLFG
jgi:hypothetical protein